MKTLSFKTTMLLIISLGLCFVFNAEAQNTGESVDAYLEALPEGLNLAEPEPQQYVMIADYYNKGLLGQFFSKTRVRGEYTRGLDEGFVRWNNVTIAESYQEEAAFPAGKAQDYMENFRYIPSEKMVEAASFANFPPNSIFVQNLVWDAMGFEVFAWEFFDSLRLNIPYQAKEVEMEIPLAGQGTFENKNARVTWVGLSRMNGERCALIQFQVMDNPLKMENEQMNMKGRSHYWGNIWVSLEDKQIEHATLSEDVLLEMKMPGQAAPQYFNTTREITLKKLTGFKGP